MRYTVIWVKRAEAALARIWMRAKDRRAVSDAANCLDRDLGSDADTKGQPFGRFFTREDRPLKVLFEVDAGDCMTRVLSVKEIEQQADVVVH